MKSKEEIRYIRAKVLPFIKTNRLSKETKWIAGKCAIKGCNNKAMPFHVFCEEHLSGSEDKFGNSLSEINDLASIFGFQHDTVKTESCRDWLQEKVNSFAGFKSPLPDDRVKFVKLFFNIQLYNYQQEFFKAFVSLPEMKNEIVTALFVRQTGKNETIANAICWLLLNYRNMRIGIFAPTEKQAQAIGLQRVRERLTSNKFVRTLIKTDMKDFIALENGSFIRAFTANPNSQIEGFTLNIAVLDESQDITDHIVSHDIVPMLASTNGSLVKIGTAGAKNHFFFSIKRNQERNKFHFQYNYLDVGKERPEYLNFVEAIAEEMGGKETPEFRSQFMNEWVDNIGMFISEKDFANCIIDEKIEDEPHSNCAYVAGLDLAKDMDDAVLTILRLEKSGYSVVIKFYAWQGEKYTDVIKQVESIYHEWRCSAIAVDSTKEDTFGEMLEEMGLNVLRVRFTSENKSNIYKNLLKLIEQQKIVFSNRGSEYKFHLRKLEKQITNLHKEWKNNTLRVYTLSERQHDDYPDSLALACWAGKHASLSFIPERLVAKKPKNNDVSYKLERTFAKEYFNNDKGNSKKDKEMVGWKSIYRVLRRAGF